MNRAERRRLKRAEDKPPTTSVEYETGYMNGMKEATEILFYMTAYTLQYKLEFGRDRLQRIMRNIFDNVDAYRTRAFITRGF